MLFAPFFFLACPLRGPWDGRFGQGPLCSDSGVWFCLSGLIVVVDRFSNASKTSALCYEVV